MCVFMCVCVTQAGVAEFGRAVRVEECEQLVGKVDPLLPLDQSLLHIWMTRQRNICSEQTARLHHRSTAKLCDSVAVRGSDLCAAGTAGWL